MTRTFGNFVFVPLLAGAACALALSNTFTELRVLALPLALFLPGYALVLALFGITARWSERLAFGIGLSLAVCAMGGVLLHLIPGGLTAERWAILLLVVTLAGIVLAWWRHRKVVYGPEPEGHHPVRLSTAVVVALAVALGLTAGAIAIARTPLPDPGARGYTSLWLLPATKAKPAIRIGAVSSEYERRSYRLQVRNLSRVIWSKRLTLNPGERWSAFIDVSAVPRRNRSFVALLHSESQRSPGPARRRATVVLPGSRVPPTTLLWLYPDSSNDLVIGMVSAHAGPTRHRVELRAGKKLVRVWRPILRPGEKWETAVDIRAIPRKRRTFTALVYGAANYPRRPALRRAKYISPGSIAPFYAAPSTGRMGP